MKYNNTATIAFNQEHISIGVVFETSKDQIRKLLEIKRRSDISLVRIGYDILVKLRKSSLLKKKDLYSGEHIPYVISDYTNRPIVETEDLIPFSVYNIGNISTVVISGKGYLAIETSKIKQLEEIIGGLDFTPTLDAKVFDDVYWNDQSSILKNDITFFANSYEWFLSRDIPFKRSYLLYGPPGNGKTISIAAIAKFFNVTPSVFDFSANYNAPDTAFANWMKGADIDDLCGPGYPASDDECLLKEDRVDNKISIKGKFPHIKLLLLEDLDRHYPQGKVSDTKVSLSSILNALDGVDGRRNTIVIATANSPEDLDQKVLLRPGRFDRRICFDCPTEEQAVGFMRRKFNNGDTISDSVLIEVASKLKGHSYALFNELFISSAACAFHNGRKNIVDNDFKTASGEHLSFIIAALKDVKKLSVGFESSKPSVGFGGS